MTYHGLTICPYKGTTYWNQGQPTKKTLLKHLHRYVKRKCHLIIYKQPNCSCLTYSIHNCKCKKTIFVEHIANFIK
jgi:hypothetical protein